MWPCKIIAWGELIKYYGTGESWKISSFSSNRRHRASQRKKESQKHQDNMRGKGVSHLHTDATSLKAQDLVTLTATETSDFFFVDVTEDWPRQRPFDSCSLVPFERPEWYGQRSAELSGSRAHAIAGLHISKKSTTLEPIMFPWFVMDFDEYLYHINKGTQPWFS